MFGWFKKDIENAPITHLTEEERAELITMLEMERDDLTDRIEALMKKIKDETGAKEYTTRRYVRGRSPNDLGYGK